MADGHAQSLTLSSFFLTTCSNNVVCLSQGRFPGGSASIAKWTRRQSRTVEENTILLFYLFLHAQKWVASVDECRTEADACHASPAPIWRLQPGLQKPINDISDGSAPPAFFCLDLFEIAQWLANTLLDICSYLQLGQAPQCDWLTVALFFFFFSRLHNESGPNPSLPYESSFVCPRCANFLDDPL